MRSDLTSTIKKQSSRTIATRSNLGSSLPRHRHPSKIELRGRRPSAYNPHRGFIGTQAVHVSSFLFNHNKRPSPYPYNASFVAKFLEIPSSVHYERSRKLTQFIKRRGLTFSKKTTRGTYKTFAVPVTTTPILLPKSVYREIQASAEVFISSLRFVLQSLYGSSSLEESPFIVSLPESIREVALKTLCDSPHYIPALHHPVMKAYPFFDAVGLDLVLTDDLYQQKKSDLSGDRKLPFQILEINAGSPSGAANNHHILEGMRELFPELLDNLPKIFPNDHFEILFQTYKSLGEFWTGDSNGIPIVLPPGGANGATPEIHQLATMSGLLYCDPTQLYRGKDHAIYVRTLSGKDPKVTSVYSRVNSDSALFNIDLGILMKDHETGEDLFIEDTLQRAKHGKHPALRDSLGQKIPMVSAYAIPDAVQAIHERKLYVGGLNRLLDNKILLPILSEFAPRFYEKELAALGLRPEGHRITPPATLESAAKSLDQVKEDPSNWVIKAPDLSGGNGVHILKCLTRREINKVFEEVSHSPGEYTYQQLVNIGRIPIAKRSKNSRGYQFSNHAVDLRMWAFFGGGRNARPRLTHNGLARVAPEEKGPLSSIVNTSRGGGYAPLIIIDDEHSPSSKHWRDVIQPQTARPLTSELPVFAGAQCVQIQRILSQIEKHCTDLKPVSLEKLDHLAVSLRLQTNEILSFLHPNNLEPVNLMLERLQAIWKHHHKSKKTLTAKNPKLRDPLYLRVQIVEQLLEKNLGLTSEMIEASSIEELRASILKKPKTKKLLELIDLYLSTKSDPVLLEHEDLRSLLQCCRQYRVLVHERHSSEQRSSFAPTSSTLSLFETPISRDFAQFDQLLPMQAGTQHSAQIRVASQLESVTGTRLVETAFVSEDLRRIAHQWSKRDPKLDEASARQQHFRKNPLAERLQEKISIGCQRPALTVAELLEHIELQPYANYNFHQFCELFSLTPEKAFVFDRLEAKRICILSEQKRKELGLYNPNMAGECFSKRKHCNTLLSESDVYFWVAEENPAVVQAYTIGHELIHVQQILEAIEMEKTARKRGPIWFAQFLNFFGNFLGSSTLAIDPNQTLQRVNRHPLFGLADAAYLKRKSPLIQDLLNSLHAGDDSFNEKLRESGAQLGWITPASNPILVKAIREIIPALENARNIRFLKSLGLYIPLDEIRAMLPTANNREIDALGNRLIEWIDSPFLSQPLLKIIVNHQLFGVRFEEKDLVLDPHYSPIYLGMSYNSVQQ